MSYLNIGKRVGKSQNTVKRYIDPLMAQLDAEERAVEVVAEERAATPPKHDPLDYLPVLKVNDGTTEEPKLRDMTPDDLPQNVETTVPTIVFVFHAIRLAKRQVSARPVFGAVLGLTGIINLFALSIALSGPGWAIPLVYLAAFLLWYVIATAMFKAKLLSPALTIRRDAHGRRYYWLEKWWKWEAVKFHDGIKQEYKGKRLIYLDASEGVVRVFNAYAALLPRLDLDPSDTEFDVTTESLADLPSMMKDVKAWVKDEEPNREIFIRQGLLAAVLGGCLFAIYWAWLSLQDVLEG